MSRDRLYFFFASVYLAQGLVGVAYEPISFLLKDGLGLGASESASFVAWMTRFHSIGNSRRAACRDSLSMD